MSGISHRDVGLRDDGRHGIPTLLLLGLLSLASGCKAGIPAPAEEESMADFHSLQSNNGLSTNGLSTNGLSTNGLSTNGLSTNGLSTNGLSTPEFANWFNANPPAYSNMVMSYVVACAYPKGSSLTWSRDSTTTYTWHGGLGLAPDWALGHPITRAEQELISACLAAHINKFALNMAISVQGWNARGSSLALDPGESTTFTEREAAFFGDLFSGSGAFACNDRIYTTPAESSARACGLSSQAFGSSVECPPLVHVGMCTTICTPDRKSGVYTSCTFGGRTYKALTTRLRPQDIYRCGDGVCQVSESCDSSRNGTGMSYNSCMSDCGRCSNI